MKVLIIEDDEPINNLFRLFAKRLGHKVEQAFDFEDAIAALRMNQFDLICCDIDLKHGRNLGVKALLQSELHGARIVFITATEYYLDAIKPLQELGYVVDCLRKPVDFGKFSEIFKQ